MRFIYKHSLDWYLSIDEKRDDYDIAFIEGSMSRTHEIEEVKKIKEKAKIVQERKEKSFLLRLLKGDFSSLIPSPLDTKFLGAQYIWQY